MGKEIVRIGQTSLAPLEAAMHRAENYARQAKAKNTLRGYRADWNDFEVWCRGHGLSSLPAEPETVAIYLSELIERCKTSTLQRRLSAISEAHRLAGHESPRGHAAVRLVWAGIRRAHGTAQEGKSPARIEEIRAMLAVIENDDLAGLRDRALLLIGFAGAFRRSELVGLDVEDLEYVREGLVITLRRSKTDQEGEGRKIGIPHGRREGTCPVRALQRWLEEAEINLGPVFRPINRHGQIRSQRLSDKAVALIIKHRAEDAGLDPDQYAGHSLRAGLATSAAAAGASERVIMNQTGHRSVQMVRRYIREGSLFRENAVDALEL